MPLSHRHDIYDDTGAVAPRHTRQPGRRSERPSRRPHARAPADAFGAFDAFDAFDMDGAMSRLQEEGERALGGWGFGSLFGDTPAPRGGLFASFDGMFNDLLGSATTSAQSSSTYVYVDPDGRVHEEHVRTVLDENGQPRTSRTVRDGNVGEGGWSAFDQVMPGMIGGPQRDAGVVVEELDSSGDEAHGGGHHAEWSPRTGHGAVEVIEEDARPRPHPAEWMRQRYNQWMNRP